MNNNIYKPGRYYAVTFIVTYILWLAGAWASHTEGRGGLYMILMLPGLLTPFIVSVLMTFRSGDRSLRRDFVNRLTNLRLIRPRILPVFFLIMPVSVLISFFISLTLGGTVEQLQWSEGFSFSTGGMSVLVVLLLAAAFEELGWRGYAFDSISSRFNYFKASLIFSVLWSLWHLPLVLVKGSYQWEIMQENLIYGLNFFLGIIPLGFIISWICIKNRKSILAAVLFHFIINMSQEMLAITQTTKCIQTAVLTLFASLIVLFDRQRFFAEVSGKRTALFSDSFTSANQIAEVPQW